MIPRVIKKASEMERIVRERKAAGRRIAFVPTMGALHEGHLSLFRAARREGDVVVSIFVNPTQFNDPKDFERYPRMLEEDLEKCRQESVDLVFAPASSEIYPDGFRIDVKAGPVGRPLEGTARPGHFDGVVTVVARLFEIVQPDTAIFGEKDYQQLLVIRQMVREQGLGVEIVAHPTVRTAEGVAMSSRNALLSAAGTRSACAIPRALEACRCAFAAEERRTQKLVEVLRGELKTEAGLAIDYAEIADAETLVPIDPMEKIDRPAVALVAVTVEGVRLIDNLRLDPLG